MNTELERGPRRGSAERSVPGRPDAPENRGIRSDRSDRSTPTGVGWSRTGGAEQEEVQSIVGSVVPPVGAERSREQMWPWGSGLSADPAPA
ncbi:unnamed protein product [Arctogadus glacialis]